MTRRATRLWRRIGVGIGLTLALTLVGGSVVLDAPAARADQIRDMSYWLTDYGFTKAWETTRGAGVTVAIIDTGVDGSIPELNGAIVGGTDVSGIGSSNGQTPVGVNPAHGTLAASLLAGRGTGEESGLLGVAPEVSLLAVSVALGTSESTVSNDDQIAEGIRWAVDNGADVINMSLTRNTLDWPESWDSAFLHAFDNDVIVVASAGNRGSGTEEVGAPATMPGVLTVGGVDRGKEASFDASTQGITIAVAAPSEELVGVTVGGGYVQWGGTSAAAPIVAGLVALVRAAHPNLDASEVINRVVATADANGHDVPSPIYGNGLINAAEAVAASVPRAYGQTPAEQLSEWIHLHRRADTATESVPTAEPLPPREVAPDPALPTRNVVSAWLPTPLTVTYITVPLLVLVGFGTLVVLLGTGATRHIRRIRRKP
ncbi:peptidase S8 [Cryobacterium melibiosiphilum]|uniref:Peptidase S8 n=1 Tax=Cryobacterium melibiosiphilum TaxID=995039 RepID=A0A3A5MLD2_9MICO|nr:S8 family serine peptidase [Cryobacterium melibiosiphilum]RJT86876.1 peptidase S8 [Cryobacterium melibiosiphilum]